MATYELSSIDLDSPDGNAILVNYGNLRSGTWVEDIGHWRQAFWCYLVAGPFTPPLLCFLVTIL